MGVTQTGRNDVADKRRRVQVGQKQCLVVIDLLDVFDGLIVVSEVSHVDKSLRIEELSAAKAVGNRTALFAADKNLCPFTSDDLK